VLLICGKVTILILSGAAIAATIAIDRFLRALNLTLYSLAAATSRLTSGVPTTSEPRLSLAEARSREAERKLQSVSAMG
jgi:hypothetical protein